MTEKSKGIKKLVKWGTELRPAIKMEPSRRQWVIMMKGILGKIRKLAFLKNLNGIFSPSINCMALSEDNSMLVTGSEDSTARMWSTKTDETECIGVLK